MATASNNSIINIEIQLKNEYNIDKRTLFYWSKLYFNQIKEGDLYTQCKKTITINILDFKYLDTDSYHSVFHLCEDKNQALKFDDMEIHILELTKFRKLIRNYKSAIGNWLLFIDGGNEEEMAMARKETPIIKVAEDARDHALSDPEARRLYELRQKQIMDEKTNLLGAEQKGKAEGRAEGKIEGKAEGKAENKIETAKKMLAKGYNLDDIYEITGLSKKDFM